MPEQVLTLRIVGQNREGLQAVQQMAGSIATLVGATVTGNQAMERSQSSLTAKLRETANTMQLVGGAGRALQGTLIVLAGAGALVAKSGMAMNDTLLRANGALEMLMGSSAEAKATIADLEAEAANTKATFSDLLPIAQNLAAAFGPNSRGEIMRTVAAFSDVQKVVGASTDSMKLAMLGFRQLVTSEKASLEDLKQISENLPGLDTRGILKAKFGTSDTEALARAGKTGREIADALLAGMEQRFGGARLKLPKDMEENLGNLAQAFQTVAGIVTQDFGEAVSQAFKDAGDSLNGLSKDAKTMEALKGMFSEAAHTVRDLSKAFSEAVKWFQSLTPEQQKHVVETASAAVKWTAWGVAIGTVTSKLGSTLQFLLQIGETPAFKKILEMGGKAVASGAVGTAGGFAATRLLPAVGASLLINDGLNALGAEDDAQRAMAKKRTADAAAAREAAARARKDAGVAGATDAELQYILKMMNDPTGGIVRPPKPGGTPAIVMPPVGPPRPPAPTWPGLDLGRNLTDLRKQDWYKEVDAMWRKAGVSTFAWEQNVLRESRGKPNSIQPGGGGRGLYQFDFDGGVGKSLMNEGLSRQQALDIAFDPIRSTEEFIKREQRGLGRVRGEQDPIAQMLAFAKYVERPKGSNLANPPANTPMGRLLAQFGSRIGQPLPPQYGGMDLDPAADDRRTLAQRQQDLGLQRKLALAEALPQGTAGQRYGRDIAISETQQEIKIQALRRVYDDAKIKDAEALSKHIKAIEDQGRAERLQRTQEFEKQQETIRQSEMGKALAQLERDLQQQERTLVEFGQSEEQVARQQAALRAQRLGELTQTLGPNLPPALREELDHRAFEATQKVRSFEKDDQAKAARQTFEFAQATGQTLAVNLQTLFSSVTAMKQQRDTVRDIGDETLKNRLLEAQLAGDTAKQASVLDEIIARRKQDKAALGNSLDDQRKAVLIDRELLTLGQQRKKVALETYDWLARQADSMKEQAQSQARSLAAMLQWATRFKADQDALPGKRADLKRAQAEAAGGDTLRTYLETQLAEVRKKIAALGTPGVGRPGDENTLIGLRLNEVQLQEDLNQFRRSTWRDFWDDLGQDAAKSVRDALSDSIAEGIEGLLGKKDTEPLKQLGEALRSILAKSIADAATEGLSDLFRGAAGNIFGSRHPANPTIVSAAGRSRSMPDDFVGPLAPGQVYASDDKSAAKGAGGILKAVPAVATGLLSLVDVFRGGKKDLTMAISQVVMSILSVMSAWPGGGAFRIFGFADGGEPPLNIPSLVGERGPELFVPRTAGTIIPNHRIALAPSSGRRDNRDLMRGGGEVKWPSFNSPGRGGGNGGGPLIGNVQNNYYGNIDSQVDLDRQNEDLAWLLESRLRTA